MNIPVAKPMVGNEEINNVISIIKSGNYISGKCVERFEERFAEYIGTKYSIACNSGTAALHLAIQSLGLPKDSEIIVPPMGFFSTISSIIISGKIPIFSDVNYRCNIDEDRIEDYITNKTVAIIPVHLYGHPCRIDKITKIAEDYNLDIIEDCAQAHGAEFNGKKVGSFGVANCFSFFATKNMTTIEGGMITTDRKEIYDYCRMVRSHGMSDHNTHKILGYNYRMNEISASIGLSQLSKLDYLNDVRIRNSRYLRHKIKKTDNLKFFDDDENVKNVYFWFPIYCNRPDEFKEHLKKNGIGFRFRYSKPLYKQPCLEQKYDNLYLTNSEWFSGRVFGLPNYPGLQKEELDKVAEVVNNFKEF